MIPQGTYRARATTGTFGESTKKGTPFIRVPFVITDGEQKGQSISWDGFFTEKTNARTIEALQFCGCEFPANDLTNITGIDRNEVSIVVEHEPYEKDGEQKVAAKVQWVNSLAGRVSEEQKMDGSKLALFRQKMEGAVLVAKTKAPPPAPTNGGGAGTGSARGKQWDGQGADPNDIPFITSQPNRWGL